MSELAVLSRDPVAATTPLPVPVAGVVFQHVPGGAVLLSTADEVYFGLNGVGAQIWEMLSPAGASVEDACARLLARYPDADPARVAHDVATLLAALRDARLVRDAAAAA